MQNTGVPPAKKSIKKNYLLNASYQILLVSTPLLTVPYVSRIFGADGIGTVSFAQSIVSYFVLVATMGIHTYGQREIAYAQHDLKKRSEVFWNTKILGFCISGITMIVYLLFAFLQREISALYLILIFNLLAVFFDITWFFQGMEEFGKIITRNALCKLLQIMYIFICIKSKEDILLYALGYGLFTMLGNCSLWLYLKKFITSVPISTLKPFKDINIVFSLFLPTIAIQIYTVLDKTMIGVITGSPYENGYYEQAMSISKALMLLVTALGTVMIPRIGYLFGQGNAEEIRRYMYRSYWFVWFLGIPLCCGVIMTAHNFVPWFFGDGYENVIPLLQILSMLILAIGINSVTGVQYLIPTRRQNIFTVTVVIGACLNFCLNLLLIRCFQARGAAIASVAAETTIAIVQLIIVRRELAVLRIIKNGIKPFVAGAVMMFALWPMATHLAPSIPGTLSMVIGGATVYIAVLIILRDAFLLDNLRGLLTTVRARK